MKNKTYNTLFYIFGIGLLVLIIFTDVLKPRHFCKMEDCRIYGFKTFSSEFEEGSDGYYFELTHWNHPEWTYEECEDYVFSCK